MDMKLHDKEWKFLYCDICMERIAFMPITDVDGTLYVVCVPCLRTSDGSITMVQQAKDAIKQRAQNEAG